MSGELLHKYISTIGSSVAIFIVGYAVIQSLSPQEYQNLLFAILFMAIIGLTAIKLPSDPKTQTVYGYDVFREALTSENISKFNLLEMYKELVVLQGSNEPQELGASYNPLCFMYADPSVLPVPDHATFLFRYYMHIILNTQENEYLNALNNYHAQLNMIHNDLFNFYHHCLTNKTKNALEIQNITLDISKKMNTMMKKCVDVKEAYMHFMSDKEKFAKLEESQKYSEVSSSEDQLRKINKYTVILWSEFQEILNISAQIK